MSHQNLIDIINDPSSRQDEIDDAIIDLGHYAEPDVIEFLFKLTHRILPDELMSSIGESLGHIFANHPNIYQKYKMTIPALPEFIQQEIFVIMRSND